jgi:peptidoglycan hydrolase-like protein with peptidoglycan-binding domain
MYAGGLGIYTKSKFPKSDMGTWERYGGEEFAPSPDKATKEQQIIVANRISVFGWKTTVTRDPDKARRMGVPQVYEWNQKPVGFTGWGCYKSKSTGKYRMAKPKLFHYDNFDAVLRVPYSFNEKSLMVKDLQTHLGVTIDGHYGKKTREAHIKFLKKNNISSVGIIPPLRKSKTIVTVSAR